VKEVEGVSAVPRAVTTFVVKANRRRQGLWTSAAYIEHIVNGLRAHDVSEEYVQHVIDVAVATNNRAGASAAEQTRWIEELRRGRS
jgi:hypothetical protein